MGKKLSIHPHFWHYILRSAHLRTLSQEAAQYYNGRGTHPKHNMQVGLPTAPRSVLFSEHFDGSGHPCRRELLCTNHNPREEPEQL